METKLKSCPFCGGEAEIIIIGNEYTKTRGVEIKCKTCKISRLQKVITQSHEWIIDKAIEHWNTRLNG